MQLTKQQIRTIIESSTILGTGGGGRLDSALEVIESIDSVNLIPAKNLQDGDVVITAYGAGGLTKPKNTGQVIAKGLELLQRQLTGPIKAIVPVEIGPYSLAAAFEMANKLGVPVVDGDLVGFRSVPEIFIELVTLAGLSRCPLVFGNNEGDLVLLQESTSPESLEQIIRTFADSSVSNTFVLGYPFTKGEILTCLAPGSVSYCLNVKDDMPASFQLVGAGSVITDGKREINGFTRGSLVIQNETDVFYVEYKNEYLVLLKNSRVQVTCPDLICVVDSETMRGLNNGDSNIGKQVRIYVKPAFETWRTPAGLGLFSPEKLGLQYKQKVLST